MRLHEALEESIRVRLTEWNCDEWIEFPANSNFAFDENENFHNISRDELLSDAWEPVLPAFQLPTYTSKLPTENGYYFCLNLEDAIKDPDYQPAVVIVDVTGNAEVRVRNPWPGFKHDWYLLNKWAGDTAALMWSKIHVPKQPSYWDLPEAQRSLFK